MHAGTHQVGLKLSTVPFCKWRDVERVGSPAAAAANPLLSSHFEHAAREMRVLTALMLLIATATAKQAPTPVLHRQCTAHAPKREWWRLRGGGGAGCPSSAAPPSTFFSGISEWHPVLLAFLGTSFGWFMTALGSAAVVLHQFGLPERTYRKVLDFMLGVSGGVMTAASYWSLLAPALEFAELQGWGQHSYAPVALGFLSGGVLLQATDWWLARMQGSLEELDLYKGLAAPEGGAEGKASRVAGLRRLLMLIIAITIHNFPEGMGKSPGPARPAHPGHGE